MELETWKCPHCGVVNWTTRKRCRNSFCGRMRPCELWEDTLAQDLIEYTLLIAFLALAAVSLILAAGQSTAGVANSASSVLTNATQQVAPTNPGSGGGSGGGSPSVPPGSF